jgi:hypothetical protein
LGIDECLVLDILDDQERLRPQIDISLWRLNPDGMVAIPPDEQGYVMLETIGGRLRADGRQLLAQDTRTGELLRTSTELLAALEDVEQRLSAEVAARRQAEEEIARLRAELERLRRSEY